MGTLGPLLLLLVAAAWFHLYALQAPFFSDDYLFLDQVRDRSLPATLAAGDPIGNYLRPVGRQLHYWVLSHTLGQDSRVFHAANLALLLASLALLYGVARRLAGARAALLCTALVALHYSADVPVLWAAGSQDLLALAGALTALSLHLRGHRRWAALPFLAAVFSKEVVALLPAIALVADRQPGERLREPARRAWPLLVAGALWAVTWAAGLAGRVRATPEMTADPGGLPAAVAHLVQVFLGLEWGRVSAPLVSVAPRWLSLALLLAALIWATAGPRRASAALAAGSPAVARRGPAAVTRSRHALITGLAWAGLGTLPVVAVAPIWSAYFYLFAICGLGLAAGVGLAAGPRALAIALPLVLATASVNTTRVEEFATTPGAWTRLSHVNRFYLTRAMARVARYQGEMRRARPALPPVSTVYFGSITSYLGWQVGDGPLVRWLYGDASLRSHFFSEFTFETTRRGPLFFFEVTDDTLRDVTDDPTLAGTVGIAQVLYDNLGAAKEWLRLGLERDPGDRSLWYSTGWTALARGDTAAALAALERGGFHPAPGPIPEMAGIRASLAAGDSISAVRALVAAVRARALDPETHALIADILMADGDPGDIPIIEAFAAQVLSPDRPESWRRWAVLQAQHKNYERAARSLRRYFQLGGPLAAADAEARQLQTLLARVLPGGDVYQASLRK